MHVLSLSLCEGEFVCVCVHNCQVSISISIETYACGSLNDRQNHTEIRPFIKTMKCNDVEENKTKKHNNRVKKLFFFFFLIRII